MQLKVFAGSAGQTLARSICRKLNIPQGDVYLHMFPSGEHYCQYRENIRGADVFLVQPICNPAHERIMELLIMVDAAKRASAGRITVVAPYLGYLRQDRKTKSRTPITARLMADLLTAAGVQRVVGMDFHCEQAQGFFNIPVDHLYAAPVFIDYLNTSRLGGKISAVLLGELIEDLKELYPGIYMETRHVLGNTQLLISDVNLRRQYIFPTASWVVSFSINGATNYVEVIKDRQGTFGPDTCKSYPASPTPFGNHVLSVEAVADLQSRIEQFQPVKAKYKKPVIVSPDAGGIKRGAALAEIIGTDFAFISKKRVSDSDVKSYGLVGEVKDRDVVIIDDMTESCGTILEAARVLKDYGANNIKAIVTHALLNETGYTRLAADKSLDELIVTDTCQPKHHTKLRILSVAPLLATAIDHINKDKSITELFEIKGF